MCLPRQAGTVFFYPITADESVNASQHGLRPKHVLYICGACGNSTNGRVVCELLRAGDKAFVRWCLCSCDKQEPTIMVVTADQSPLLHLPLAAEFRIGQNWPHDLAELYSEATKSFAAGAFTAASMVARKILMACACHEGDEDGKSFMEYVNFITGTVLTFPKAAMAIDAIRSIGNEANHHLKFVSEKDAQRSLQIVTYMLNTIYSLPSA